MNQEALKGMVMTVVVSVVTSAIVGGAIFYSLSSGDDYREKKMYLKNPATTDQNAMMDQKKVVEEKKEDKVVMGNDKIATFNCKQTGGTFANAACTCPKDHKYNTETGYCMGAMGVPGGELQSEEAVKLELVMLKNTIVDYNCTQSGGTFKDLKCTCPKMSGDQLKYDVDTGYCMDSFGTPGGELGQTERKLQELQMLKNQ